MSADPFQRVATLVKRHAARHAAGSVRYVRMRLTNVSPMELVTEDNNVRLSEKDEDVEASTAVIDMRAADQLTVGDLMDVRVEHDTYVIVGTIADPDVDSGEGGGGGGGGGGSDTPPGAWVALGPYLNPRWATPVNLSVTDLTDDFCPRVYLDRDRVYLGGVVYLDTSISSSMGVDTIFRGLPAPYVTHRQQEMAVFKDVYFSNLYGSGSPVDWGDTAFFWSSGSPQTTGLFLTHDVANHPPNGTAISLDGLSYRIS